MDPFLREPLVDGGSPCSRWESHAQNDLAMVPNYREVTSSGAMPHDGSAPRSTSAGGHEGAMAQDVVSGAAALHAACEATCDSESPASASNHRSPEQREERQRPKDHEHTCRARTQIPFRKSVSA